LESNGKLKLLFGEVSQVANHRDEVHVPN